MTQFEFRHAADIVTASRRVAIAPGAPCAVAPVTAVPRHDAARAGSLAGILLLGHDLPGGQFFLIIL